MFQVGMCLKIMETLHIVHTIGLHRIPIVPPSLGFSWLTFFHSYEGHESLNELFPLLSRLLPFSSNEGVYHFRTFYRVVLYIRYIVLPSS